MTMMMMMFWCSFCPSLGASPIIARLTSSRIAPRCRGPYRTWKQSEEGSCLWKKYLFLFEAENKTTIKLCCRKERKYTASIDAQCLARFFFFTKYIFLKKEKEIESSMIKACCRKKRNYIRPIDPLMSGSRLLFNRQTPFWGDGVMTPAIYQTSEAKTNWIKPKRVWRPWTQLMMA